jgi:hypothetical protein
VNALEMKLIAMKFALSRKAYVPNDTRFTSSSGAYDVGSIQQQLSQGTVIDDRDLTINNTIIEECEHEANVAVAAATTPPIQPTDSEPPEPEPIAQQPQVQLQEPVPEIHTEHVEPEIKVEPADPAGFGGRLWQYFKDTTNVQPKP